MQFDLLTNMSDPFPKKIVRERLTQSSALYGERLRDIVYSVVAGYLFGGEIAGFRVLGSGGIPLPGRFGFAPSFFSIR